MLNNIKCALFAALLVAQPGFSAETECPAEKAYWDANGLATAQFSQCEIFFQDIDRGNSVLIQLKPVENAIQGALSLSTDELIVYRNSYPDKVLVIVSREGIWQQESSWCKRLSGEVYTLAGGVRGVPIEFVDGQLLLTARETALAKVVGDKSIVELSVAEINSDKTRGLKDTVIIQTDGNVFESAVRHQVQLSSGLMFSKASFAEVQHELKLLRIAQTSYGSTPNRHRCNKGL